MDEGDHVLRHFSWESHCPVYMRSKSLGVAGSILCLLLFYLSLTVPKNAYKVWIFVPCVHCVEPLLASAVWPRLELMFA